MDADFPVWLTTGRRLASYHTRTQTGRAAGIDYLLPEEVLEVHPDDVAAWGLKDGGLAVMSRRRGAATIHVKATDRSPRGTALRITGPAPVLRHWPMGPPAILASAHHAFWRR